MIGFLGAARKGENDLASRYLRTTLTGRDAAVLSHRLFVVLDARLPARLTQLSDTPEGSRANPLTPDKEVVGVIESASGEVPIVVDRVTGGEGKPIWLFSEKTLESVPALFEEVTNGWGSGILGRFLNRTRFGRLRALEWLVVVLSLVVFWVVILVLNRILAPVIRWASATLFPQATRRRPDSLPLPVRLLFLTAALKWFLASVSLSLFVRQFWSNAASLIGIAASVWLLILLNGELERKLRHRVPGPNVVAAASLLRLLRRGADVIFIFAGLLATLRVFAIDLTPALAGLGVGGIAVALAAQKTLENVIAGASLIVDQAVRVGDFLKMGDVVGTVDHIGLRSTRIRTLDRTIVSVPNSQIANATLETISARDKYWFHPVVGLRYETTSVQLTEVVESIRRLLDDHAAIDPASVRVRFLRLGAFSLDVDVSAYVFARDWNHFLEIQEQLLFAVTASVERAGAEIAFPSQTMYLAGGQASLPAANTARTP